MAGGYNRIVMVGNLTRDPELKQLPSGQGVCRLNLASNRQFKNRQSGDMVQEVCYVDIDVWGPQADSCNQYLQKGRQVLIEGRLKLDSWQDQEGNNRSKHSIVADRVVFLSSGNNVEVADGAEATTGNGPSQFGATKVDDTFEPRNDVERELMSQLNNIKKRTTSTVKPAAQAKKTTLEQEQFSQEEVAPRSASVAFKDEPPFQDDLPF
jgi:single-strand DNA-binding protein